jgi:uncharacterized DUF497 family protein
MYIMAHPPGNRAMPPIIEEFRCSPQAARRMLEKHGVEQEEALEAAESTDRHQRSYEGAQGEKRYIIAGRTGAGRRLWVVFADSGGGHGDIITAREPLTRRSIARHREAG